MKLIVQRVNHASCIVDGDITGSITNGVVVYVGFTHSDTESDISYLAKKLANLRIFNDQNGIMNTSLIDNKYAVLSISQFTLYGNTTKGNRPSYTDAMKPELATKLYDQFNDVLRHEYGLKVETGLFGEHMIIHQENDGPVTIELRSKGE